MFKHVCVCAALLTVSISSAEMADERSERRAKRAQKVLEALHMLGIDNPKLNNLIKTADKRTVNGYFYVAQEHFEDGVPGQLALRYDTGGSPGLKRLELSYTPDQSNYELTANQRGIMLRYHYDIPVSR